jgi:hypothetical protein
VTDKNYKFKKEGDTMTGSGSRSSRILKKGEKRIGHTRCSMEYN